MKRRGEERDRGRENRRKKAREKKICKYIAHKIA
jgi:hypothetical protein